MRRRSLLSASTCMLVATAAPVAQAHPNLHYTGGCGWFTVSDGTDSPQTQWDGEVHVVAVATDAVTGAPAAVPITVECELRINGATPGTVVFSASGTGVAVGADRVSFNADPDDVVVMCDHVTVGGEFHKDCGVAPEPVIPPPVQDAIDEVAATVDSVICGPLAAQHGGPADQPPVDIRSDGDLYVAGRWVVDCPPYGTSGSTADGGVVTTAGALAFDVYDEVRDTRRDVQATTGPMVDPIVHEITSTQELRSWVDGIHIVRTSWFVSPVVTYEGAFANSALWDCTEQLGGAPTVTCVADPGSGIDWDCGLMHLQAEALSESDFDSPSTLYWGRVSGYVACDADELQTAQATQANPVETAVQQMGSVVTVVCRAQLEPNDTSPPVAPYEVVCVDPPYVRE